MPCGQRGRVAVVDFDAIEFAPGARGLQPLVERTTEAAEVGVLAVAERQYGVAQRRQCRR